MDETNNNAPWGATTLLTGAETGDRIALIEYRVAAGHEPPCQSHVGMDKLLYVLTGTLTMWIGDETRHLPVGATVFVPRGTDHGFVLTSPEARLLVLLAPPGPTGFYAQADLAPDARGFEELIAAAARCGTAITGPPPCGG